VSLSILTNISAMDTNRNLQASSSAVSKAMQDLSSGLRINTAADDAAGYAISQGMTDQVNGYNQASQNIGDATNMVQTAESAFNNVQSMMQRVYELGVQYNNGDLNATDQSAIQSEVNQLTSEIDRQAQSVQFNGTSLLNGTAGANANGTVTFQVGANSADTLVASFTNIEGSAGAGLGLNVFGTTWAGTATSLATVIDLSSTSLASINEAITNVSSMAANLGAVQNRLQYAANEVSAISENLSSANSSIEDVDMASEMTTMTQQQVLQQAGTAMLSQANSEPQLVLKLLGG
jgi:flagellin